MNSQLDIFKARQNRDKGMQRAVDHANSEVRDWETMAYDFLKIFIKHHHGEFLCENVREQSKGVVPNPPNLRSWGYIMSKARREGLITTEKTRKVKNPNANCANAAVWKRV